MKKSKKTNRIKSKARFIIFITITLTMIISGVGTLVGANTSISMTKPQFEEIEIHSGDTLWNIATEYKLENQDIRTVVHEICDINQITANSLQPGQKVKVPIYI